MKEQCVDNVADCRQSSLGSYDIHPFTAVSYDITAGHIIPRIIPRNITAGHTADSALLARQVAREDSGWGVRNIGEREFGE